MKRMFSIMVLFSIIALLNISVLAESSMENSINSLVKRSMTENHIPGLALAISLPNGKQIEKSYGIANFEYNAPIKKDSIFPVGCLTKVITVIGVLKLQEEGKININDKLSKYFPKFPHGNEITIKNILQNTAGIKNVLRVEPLKSNEMKDFTPQELIASIKNLPLNFKPGTKVKYGNTGYIMLGLIIEKITGMSYGEFIKKYVTKPLGMNHTFLGTSKEIVPNRVAGYGYRNNKYYNAQYISPLNPFSGGGIFSTASDILKLKKAFQSGVIINEKDINKLFTPVCLKSDGTPANEKMFYGETLYYGYACDIIKYKNEFIPGKTGGWSGFTSYFCYFPKQKLMIVLLSNMQGVFKPLINLAKEISTISLKD